MLALALAAVVGLAVVGGSGRPDGRPTRPGEPGNDARVGGDTAPAQLAARRFLDAYVDPDGRVVRRDQGGDTVSEGQAYGMLLAVVADDDERFASIWAWTRRELLRDDGLLAWHWVDGMVVDPQPASDADLDVARALLAAADRFDEPSYRDQARGIGRAILERETVAAGEWRVLVAGPWATDAPQVLNPSYFAPRTFDLLLHATGDDRWAEVREGSLRMMRELTSAGNTLPPDWATLGPDGAAAVASAPDGTIPRYGYEAFRAVVRSAEACDVHHRALARSWRTPVARTLAHPAEAHDLTGAPIAPGHSSLSAIAAAATQTDRGRVEDLLAEAERTVQATPTYYLAAWAALGRAFLQTDLLGTCPAPLTPDQGST